MDYETLFEGILSFAREKKQTYLKEERTIKEICLHDYCTASSCHEILEERGIVRFAVVKECQFGELRAWCNQRLGEI